MWSMFNRELAKYRKAREGVPDTSYAGVFQQALEAGQQQSAFKERKNSQMQKMLDLQIEGYQSNFGGEEIQKKQDRLQEYIDRNQGGMNDMTLEYANLLKDNIKTHSEKVGKFKEDIDMLEVNRDQWLQKADDYFNREDALNEQDYGDIEDSIDDYVRMKNEMVENNADFLQLPAYKHVLTNMVGQEAVMNDLLKEAQDQGVFTEYEHKYLTQALKTGDYSIIEEERAKKKVLTAELMKSYVTGPEGVEVAYARNELFKKLERGDQITVPQGETIVGYTEGNTLSKSILEDEGLLSSFLEDSDSAQDDLNRKNKIYETKTGNSYIIERGGEPDEYEFKSDEIKIFKDHFGMTDDEIAIMTPKSGSEKLNEYGQKMDINKYKTGPDKDDDSAWPNIATGLVGGYFVGQATGMNQKLVEGSKQVLNATKEGMKYVHHVAKNVPLEDISSLMDDKVVAEAIEDLNGLREKMDVAKESGEYSKAYKDAVKKYNKKVTQHANALKTGGKINLEGVRGSGKKVTKAIKSFNVKEIEKLLKTPNKWRTLKIKRNALKILPGLAKGWRTFRPGGGFAAFEMGRRATREFAEKMFGEGLGAEVTGVLGGVGAQKAVFSKVSKKIASKAATAAGRNWLVKKIAKKVGAKIAVSTVTGLMAGGGTPASIATGTIGLLAGLGMAGLDVYDLFFKGEEEEE